MATKKANTLPAPTPANAKWQPGQSGNPAGRPAGSRNRLASIFLADLLETYTEGGKACIKRAMEESPISYLQIIQRVVPKELLATVDLKTSQLELSEDQRRRIAENWIVSQETSDD